jgi:Fe2+ transport system protein FeoA
MTLDKLKNQKPGVVTQVGGAGTLRLRLLDMGIIPGTQVIVRKRAPMGDPLEIHLRGYALTIRQEDARNILVEEAD